MTTDIGTWLIVIVTLALCIVGIVLCIKGAMASYRRWQWDKFRAGLSQRVDELMKYPEEFQRVIEARIAAGYQPIYTKLGDKRRRDAFTEPFMHPATEPIETIQVPE